MPKMERFLSTFTLLSLHLTGLLRIPINFFSMCRDAMVREKIWIMKFFPGQGKVREFCGWPGKFRKDLESQGKVREFENKRLWQAVFIKFIYSVQDSIRTRSRFGNLILLPEITMPHNQLEKTPFIYSRCCIS